jgi:hypothetical protein
MSDGGEEGNVHFVTASHSVSGAALIEPKGVQTLVLEVSRDTCIVQE